MDIGTMIESRGDHLIDALMSEKDRLEALMNGYEAVSGQLNKVNGCISLLCGKAAVTSTAQPPRKIYPRQEETLTSAVRRILIAASPLGMTAREINIEMNKSHPDRSIAATSQALCILNKKGSLNHVGNIWSYRATDSAAA